MSSDIFIHKHTGTVSIRTDKGLLWVKSNLDLVQSYYSPPVPEFSFKIDPDCADELASDMTTDGLEVESR